MSFLNFTNFRDHPTERKYMVFFFTDSKMAHYFEELLVENNISYERATEDEGVVKRYLFGVLKRDFEIVHKFNNVAIGKYRQPFIPTAGLRWLLLIVMMVSIALAIAGYLKITGS